MESIKNTAVTILNSMVIMPIDAYSESYGYTFPRRVAAKVSWRLPTWT